MSNKYKDIYKMLAHEQKSEFMLWATSKYNRRATSIENHWIGKGAVPDRWAEEIYTKLEELQKL